MSLVFDIESWMFRILFVGLLALRVWAFADCLARKNAAFPAAGKLTKPAWALLNAFSVGISLVLQYGQVISILSLITLVVTLVYLADVRPAVREISGGSRW